MSTAMQNALKPVPAQLIDITLSRSANSLRQSLFDFRPGHVIPILPAGSSSVNGCPVSYTWRLEVDDVSITRFAAVNGNPPARASRPNPRMKCGPKATPLSHRRITRGNAAHR